MPSLPWNQNDLIGYFGEMCFSVMAANFYMSFNGAIEIIFVSMCLHHRAFLNMFQHYLLIFDTSDEHRNDEIHLCNLIRFHIMVKRSVECHSNLYANIKF